MRPSPKSSSERVFQDRVPDLGYCWPSTGVKKASPWKTSKQNLKKGSRGLSARGQKRPGKKESKMTIFQVFVGFSGRFRLVVDFFRAC